MVSLGGTANIDILLLTIDQGAAIIIDDSALHHEAVSKLTDDDKDEILAFREEERDKLGLVNYEESQKRKEIAIENAKRSGKWKTKSGKSTETEEDGLLGSIESTPQSETTVTESDGPTSVAPDAESKDVDAEAELSQTIPKRASQETALRQYIVPMTSSPVGAYALPYPQLSVHIPAPPTPRYDVYQHLQSLGYFLSPGLRFGCQFLAYPGD